MKQTYTAVIERAEPVTGVLASEPYEAGWAEEALVFVKVRTGLPDDAELAVKVQISPDGIDWIDHHAGVEAAVRGAGLVSIPVRDFGNWLRVVGTASDPEALIRVSVYV
ncbi:MAG: hypothetical protein ACRDT1_04485, partial [Micromonosporaceae bacterium]